MCFFSQYTERKQFGYCMSNTASATTPGCADISLHCVVCRTQPVLQHQAVHISHDTAVCRTQPVLQHQAVHISDDTVLYVEHSQCYNTRLCTHLTTLLKSKHTISATLQTQRLSIFTHPQLTIAIQLLCCRS
jgi:hypothetical protein